MSKKALVKELNVEIEKLRVELEVCKAKNEN